MSDGSRWLTYDDMAEALGITPDSARRLATRHRWPRRPGNDGRALVAVPAERLDRPHEPRAEAGADGQAESPPEADRDAQEAGRDARALIGYLHRRVGELTDELAASRRVAEEARAEAREARTAAEASRAQADVLTALAAAERAHLAEVRIDRERLVTILAERKAPWIERVAARLRRTS